LKKYDAGLPFRSEEVMYKYLAQLRPEIVGFGLVLLTRECSAGSVNLGLRNQESVIIQALIFDYSVFFLPSTPVGEIPASRTPKLKK